MRLTIKFASLALLVSLPTYALAQERGKPSELLLKPLELKNTAPVRKNFVLKEGRITTIDGAPAGPWLCTDSVCYCDYRFFDCTDGTEVCALASDGQPDAECHEGICTCTKEPGLGAGPGSIAPSEFLLP